MLRIAVQSKGRLFEDTMNLLAEADIKVSASKRKYQDAEHRASQLINTSTVSMPGNEAFHRKRTTSNNPRGTEELTQP